MICVGSDACGHGWDPNEGTDQQEPPTAEDVKRDAKRDIDALLAPPPGTQKSKDFGSNVAKNVGCFAILLSVLLVFYGEDEDTTRLAMAATTTAGLTTSRTRRVTRHGHVLLGAISGLLFGIGTTVSPLSRLAQQPVSRRSCDVTVTLAHGAVRMLRVHHRDRPGPSGEPVVQCGLHVSSHRRSSEDGAASCGSRWRA